MNGADLIARRLHAAGCRDAFGIPGGEVLALVDAMERAGIRFRLCRHENAGGFMAEGTWHATGAPGVLVATVGPGIANCVNVVENAREDRVPLIVISGTYDLADQARYTHQVFDHTEVFRRVSKASLVFPGEGSRIRPPPTTSLRPVSRRMNRSPTAIGRAWANLSTAIRPSIPMISTRSTALPM